MQSDQNTNGNEPPEPVLSFTSWLNQYEQKDQPTQENSESSGTDIDSEEGFAFQFLDSDDDEIIADVNPTQPKQDYFDMLDRSEFDSDEAYEQYLDKLMQSIDSRKKQIVKNTMAMPPTEKKAIVVETKEIALTGGYFSTIAVILVPIILNGQTILFTLTNSTNMVVVLDEIFQNCAAPFGGYALPPEEKPEGYIDDYSTSVLIGKRNYYGTEKTNDNVYLGAVQVEKFPFMHVTKISGKTYEDSAFITALCKYQNIFGLSRPENGSLIKMLKDNGYINHCTFAVDMSEMKDVSAECKNVPIVLGRKDTETANEFVVKLYDKQAFQNINDPSFQISYHKSCLMTWGERTAVTKIVKIMIEKPNGQRQTINYPPIFALIDMAVDKSSFCKELFERITQSLKSSVGTDRSWYATELWTEGVTAFSKCKGMVEKPVQACPRVILCLETRNGELLELSMDKDQYIRKLPEYTIIHKSKCCPQDRVINIEEVKYGLSCTPPNTHPKLCVLGNNIFCGKTVLFDYEENGLFIYDSQEFDDNEGQ